MAYIIEGRRIALEECTKQFSGRRWNCTFPEPDVIPFLHPNMPIGNIYSLAVIYLQFSCIFFIFLFLKQKKTS